MDETASPRKNGRRRWTPIAFAVGGSIAAVGLAASYGRAAPEPPGLPPGIEVGSDSVTLAPQAVQWKAIKLGSVQRTAERYGDPAPARVLIDESEAAHVGVPLSGRITKVWVELGQAVKAGDPLFSVTSPDIADLRAEKSKAAVDLEVARTSHERIAAMVAARALPAKEELASAQGLRQAELAWRLAGSKLRSLQIRGVSVDGLVVSAPRSGVVVEKNVFPSQEVGPDSGATLVVVADLSNVWVIADRFPGDAQLVVKGTPAKITLPSKPGVEIAARAEMVSAVIDPVRQAAPVRLRVDNQAGLLRPNDWAQVRFLLPGSDAVEIAASALVSDGARQFVFVQESEGHFVRREVVTGSSSAGRVPVLTGLRAGDMVVERGALLLDNQISLFDS